jgi:hypothetical protein
VPDCPGREGTEADIGGGGKVATGLRGRSRRRDAGTQAVIRAIAIAGLLVLTATGCGGTTSESEDDLRTDRLPFDRDAWALDRERWAMSADLKQRHLPVGMTREAVLVLLGPATESDPQGLHYDVGQYWLDVLFDEHGRIRETLLCSY